MIQRRLADRRPGCDLIFHRGGKRMGEDKDRRIFEDALKALELPYGRGDGLTIYSVKSTAVGTMYHAGLAEAEIMSRSGHKTDQMLRRYLKQKPERAHAVSEKVEKYVEERRVRDAERKARDAEKSSPFAGRIVVA